VTLRWREMDSNFRLRVRCKRGLRRKSPASAACGRRSSAAAVGGHQLRCKSEISEPNPIARGTGSSNPLPSSGESYKLDPPHLSIDTAEVPRRAARRPSGRCRAPRGEHSMASAARGTRRYRTLLPWTPKNKRLAVKRPRIPENVSLYVGVSCGRAFRPFAALMFSTTRPDSAGSQRTER
jgi:hypothetical protein